MSKNKREDWQEGASVDFELLGENDSTVLQAIGFLPIRHMMLRVCAAR